MGEDFDFLTTGISHEQCTWLTQMQRPLFPTKTNWRSRFVSRFYCI